jgi:hypothetical protein
MSTEHAELAALQAADRIECERDPLAFLERHVTIEEPNGTVIPLGLWPFQRKTVDVLTTETLTIVLKARRLGLSWIALALALWQAIFQPGIRILILCKTEGDATELLDRIRRMRDRLAADPAARHILAPLQRPAKTRDAVTTLDIGPSTIRALVGTPAAARSETAGLVIWDEAAFQQHAEDIWQGLLPTIEGGGRLWIISTGNGLHGRGSMYAELWQNAVRKANGFASLFWPWDARPDRDPAWKVRQVAAIGSDDRFRVEYPETPDDAFIVASGTPVYSREGIAAAVRLGAEFDARREAGTMTPPVGGVLYPAADFGEHSHVLVLWPLEAGGFYVTAEHPFEHSEPDKEAPAVARLIHEAGVEHPVVDWVRFDASRPESARMFIRTFRPAVTGPAKLSPVPFGQMTKRGSFKRLSILYLRRLFNRTAAGERIGVIAISPSCTRLVGQLEALQFKDDDSEDVVKLDDHGPDALIAGVAPEARRFSKRLEQSADHA